MIDIQNVSKRYGDSVVVDGVTLALPAGGVTAIIGPNGAGKSTLLSMISRLLPLSEGRVLVEGLDVARADSRELARRQAILRQDNHLPLRLTVRDLVAFGRYPHSGGRLTLQDKEHVDRAIDYLELEPWPTATWTRCPAASASAPSWRWCCARTRATCCWTSR